MIVTLSNHKYLATDYTRTDKIKELCASWGTVIFLLKAFLNIQLLLGSLSEHFKENLMRKWALRRHARSVPARCPHSAVPLKDAAHGAWISLPWQEEPARVGSGEPHRNKALGTQGSFPCGAPAGCLFSLSSFWLSPGARHLLPYSALLWQMSARETARPKPSNTDKPLLRPRTKLLE